MTDRIWLVSFMDYDLGYFDDETSRLVRIENSFGPKSVTYVSGMDLQRLASHGNPNWNQIHAFLQQMARLREVADWAA